MGKGGHQPCTACWNIKAVTTAGNQPTPINRRAKHNARERKRRGVGLKRPLDVPFLVQLAQPLVNPLGMICVPTHARRDFRFDLANDPLAGVLGHSREVFGTIVQLPKARRKRDGRHWSSGVRFPEPVPP